MPRRRYFRRRRILRPDAAAQRRPRYRRRCRRRSRCFRSDRHRRRSGRSDRSGRRRCRCSPAGRCCFQATGASSRRRSPGKSCFTASRPRLEPRYDAGLDDAVPTRHGIEDGWGVALVLVASGLGRPVRIRGMAPGYPLAVAAHEFRGSDDGPLCRKHGSACRRDCDNCCQRDEEMFHGHGVLSKLPASTQLPGHASTRATNSAVAGFPKSCGDCRHSLIVQTRLRTCQAKQEHSLRIVADLGLSERSDGAADAVEIVLRP